MIPASELDTPRTIEEYNAAVERVRMASASRRTQAWANVPERVLGLELRPITPAIFTVLCGTENAFVWGRLPLEHDLRNFVWFCSPQFDADKPVWSAKWRPVQMFRLNCALKRRAYHKQKPAEAILKNFLTGCAEVREILARTNADCVPPTTVEGEPEEKPLAAAQEAQFVDLFAREYKHWPLPQPVRHTPIMQLNQLARCIDRSTLGYKARYYDPAEHALDRAFLATLNPPPANG